MFRDSVSLFQRMECLLMRRAMQHQFSQVPRAEIQRSSFDRSHGYKTTLNASNLVPIYVDEALPGDTFNLRANVFGRLATPLHPIMDNLHMEFFFFAVPYRLIWANFKRFFGEQENPTDTTSFLVPQIVAPAGGFVVGSLFDYFGIPTGSPLIKVNALHARAYNLIYNQWFRDENLQTSVPFTTGDGPDPDTNYTVLQRGKRHDYFTSALPWPQKGPAVSIPLGSTAPVGTASTPQFTGTGKPTMTFNRTGTGLVPSSGSGVAFSGSGGLVETTETGKVAASGIYPTNLYADLSTATAATINQLRQAFQIQKIYERDARGGTRYTELIRSHFGVTSPDARLQRSEYLGGGHSMVNVNPIAQTSNTADGPAPLGSLGAMGTVSSKSGGFTKSFTEHCVLIGLCCVRADLTYQQGLDRMWSRQTRWDYYWPALAHIGEQAILNKEIYCEGNNAPADEAVFGYQERYAEYRFKHSILTGHFRSSYAQSLDTWHLAQNFAGLPTLNSTFIKENVPLQRAIAVPAAPQFLVDCYFQLHCARPMPLYGVPGNIDRF
ncbi:major capsid protein [Blackfly microvirus SF02]|uniref:Major capsid protein n=1 Tax=Blackfly microvirus SF02 TaxID=2576452 RepID=A0A4P8PPK5_9VIRU|nr:major capsid protein [Blackfly microvirus SF02]